MYEMHRKTLSKALLNYETINELKERKMSYTFGPKMEYGEQKSYQETQNEFMQHIDHLRSHETYKCPETCQNEGLTFVNFGITVHLESPQTAPGPLIHDG